MATLKIVHAADVHLDSPLDGLDLGGDERAAEVFRGATRKALGNLVELCLSEEAAVLLLAGDLFDGDWRDYQTGIWFARQIARLTGEGVRVVLARGNHDAESAVTKKLRWPAGVHELSTRKPETVVFEDLGLAVHGRGYPRAALADDISADYPAPRPGLLNVGLLHTSAGGRPGHENYAPCRVEALSNHGYDYWALGHVHAREVLCRDPFIVFPGNLQGRHVRETGAKGAMLLTVEDGRLHEPRFHALDAVRWARLDLDAEGLASVPDVLDRLRADFGREVERADGRPVAVRVHVGGACPAHAALASAPDQFEAEVRAAAAEASVDGLFVERVTVATRVPHDLSEMRRRDDPVGSLLRGLAALRSRPDELAGLAATLLGLRDQLPSEARLGPDGFDPGDPDTLARLLEEVEQLLVPRLMGEDRR